MTSPFSPGVLIRQGRYFYLLLHLVRKLDNNKEAWCYILYIDGDKQTLYNAAFDPVKVELGNLILYEPF